MYQMNCFKCSYTIFTIGIIWTTPEMVITNNMTMDMVRNPNTTTTKAAAVTIQMITATTRRRVVLVSSLVLLTLYAMLAWDS